MNVFSKYLLVIVCVLLIACGCSRSRYGQVRDADTDKPISRARIEVFAFLSNINPIHYYPPSLRELHKWELRLDLKEATHEDKNIILEQLQKYEDEEKELFDKGLPTPKLAYTKQDGEWKIDIHTDHRTRSIKHYRLERRQNLSDIPNRKPDDIARTYRSGVFKISYYVPPMFIFPPPPTNVYLRVSAKGYETVLDPKSSYEKVDIGLGRIRNVEVIKLKKKSFE